ncbi:MAG: hypothetical protein QOC99_3420 [Acidobacteriota bacterium]|jgi:hypothetical protein|nr:hypothetical protein [Acidobacteriota bacterium]MDT7780908.1 hypothetical protein [Acidobacteriota bacterium]
MKFAAAFACVSALALCLATEAAAQVERGLPSTSAKSSGTFQNVEALPGNFAPEARAFEFELNGFSYHIAANGNGRRTKGDKTRRFNLQLDGSDYIENIYFSEHAGDLLLVCGVTNGVDGAGFIVRLEQPSMRARWKQHLPSFNVGQPLREDHFLYLTAIGFVGKLDLETGEYAWKHDGLYDTRERASQAFTTFDTPEIKGDTVLFKDGVLFKDKAVYNPRKTVVVNKKSGKIISIE